jgi:predicted permease
VPALNNLGPQNLPIAEQPGVDLRVLAFATVVVLITALAFSIVPALRASRVEALGSLREDARSGGGRQRVRSALVVVEVMASVVLLISSGLLVRAIWRLQAVDPGFRAENTLTLRTALPWPRYADPRDRQPFYDEVLRGVSALPGVESAAYISFLPMTMRGGIWPVIMRGDEAVRSAANSASLRYATPRIFDALGIPLRAGRAIDATDRADSPPTAVVSESFAQRYWPNEPALGKRFNIAFKERTVVGIVGNVRVRGLEQQSEPQVYLPYQQQDSGSLTNYTPQDLVIRSTAAPEVLIPAIRRIVRAADPLQPISAIRTMEDVVANETASRAAQLRVLAILAGVALLLSAIGIHGLLSFTVSRRSREIGVRMALGAQSAQVRRMILREGAVLAVAGVVPGVAIAYAAGRGMQSLLAGVAPGDVPTFAAATALCVVATLIGCAAPAFRASRVDPISAIRAD